MAENKQAQTQKTEVIFSKVSVALAITEKYRQIKEPDVPKIPMLDYTKAYDLFANFMGEEAKQTFFSFLQQGKIPPVSVSSWDEEVLKALSKFVEVEEIKENKDGQLEELLKEYKQWIAKEYPDYDPKKLKKLTTGRVRISELYNMLASKKPDKPLPNYWGKGIKNITKANLKALDTNFIKDIRNFLEAS